MKISRYQQRDAEIFIAFRYDDYLIPLHLLNESYPKNDQAFLHAGTVMLYTLEAHYALLLDETAQNELALAISEVKLLAPFSQIPTFRDAYAFRQHVATSRSNRGVEMIPEFDEFPVFYFSNPHSFQGPGEIALMPDHFQKLDFELEIAIVIGKEGINIKAIDADDYILGFMVLNDISARALQMEEMKLNLGPAKGKDFANAVGSTFVTAQSLEKHIVPTATNHIGNSYSLEMKAYHNGEQISQGNFKDMHWTFAEIIERCSYGATLYPGDVIGSGTVGTGCYLEINGTRKRENPNYEPIWLQANDEIKLEIEALGSLNNKFVPIETKHSLFALKK